MDRIIREEHDLKVRTGMLETKKRDWDRRKIEIDPQELRLSYDENKGHIPSIAKEFKVSDNTIRLRLRAFDIMEAKPKAEKTEKKIRQQNGRSMLLTVMFRMNQTFTRQFMQRALVNHGNDIEKAAQWIGGSEQQFRYYMKKLKITFSGQKKKGTATNSQRLDTIENLLKELVNGRKS